MEYYSVIKRSELLSQTKSWRNLKCTLSKRSQFEKARYLLYDSKLKTFWKMQNYGDVDSGGDCE